VASDQYGHCLDGCFQIRKLPSSMYGCGHTKTSYNVEILLKGNADDISEIMRTQPYSIATNGSNDYGAVKLYLIVL